MVSKCLPVITSFDCRYSSGRCLRCGRLEPGGSGVVARAMAPELVTSLERGLAYIPQIPDVKPRIEGPECRVCWTPIPYAWNTTPICDGCKKAVYG
jgi:hypothetical protein